MLMKNQQSKFVQLAILNIFLIFSFHLVFLLPRYYVLNKIHFYYDRNKGDLVEIINIPSTTSLSSLPGNSRNFHNISSGTFQNVGSTPCVQNPLTTAARQPLPLEEFRKVMTPSLSR